MERRKALGILAGAALAPAVAFSAGPRMRVVGMLRPSPGNARYLSAAMAKLGWVEGRHVRYEVASLAYDAPDIDEIASRFARSGVDVLVASGVNHVLALFRATKTIPIVCGGISDPVEEGVAQSEQKPGMNVTGLSFGLRESAALQLGVLHAMVPGLRRVLFLTTANEPGDRPATAHANAARALGLESSLVKARDLQGVESLLAAHQGPGATAAWFALLPPDVSPKAAAALALRHRMASHGMNSEWVREGMMMSYWLRHTDPPARIAAIVDKVLRGTDPGRIPFELPDRTDLSLNRSTVQALGLKVPPEILIRATEVVG